MRPWASVPDLSPQPSSQSIRRDARNHEKANRHVGWHFLARKLYTGISCFTVISFTAVHRYCVLFFFFLTNWRFWGHRASGKSIGDIFPKVSACLCLCVTFW